MKLMSLFDGSGGFPLAASLCGIEPVYAAEVEPYPIAVTKNRFPKMKHLGDVSKVKGGEIEPVDIITFGSPCQDMSIAGKRAGLKHADMGDDETTRSGLFLEAIRIIKEMREATNGVYPRYAIWENVPGAFSSNRGEDFRTVLEEFIRVKEKDAVMPDVPKAGWPYADCYSGNGWSLAYRVFNAQYWGVPQRRRRIYLVADFRGQRAGEILFESEGLSGYSKTGRCSWQKIAGGTEGCTGETGTICLNDQGGERMDVTEDKTSTLRAQSNHPPLVFENHSQDSRFVGLLDKAQTVLATFGTGGNNQPFVMETPKTLKIRSGCEGGGKGENAKFGFTVEKEIEPTIVAKGPGAVAAPTYTSSKASFFTSAEKEVANTLVATDYKDPPLINDKAYIVRRLTPTECARLQGFPDWWGEIPKKDNLTDDEYVFWLNVRNTYAKINNKTTKEYSKEQMLSWYNKLHSDSSEYKMWGNGIALPNALYVMQGIAEVVGVHHSK